MRLSPTFGAEVEASRTSVFLSVVAVTALGQAGPFGFEKGMTQQQVIHLLGKPMKSDGDQLMFDTAPKPHAAYVVYALDFSPKAGLLRVVAGRSHRIADDHGTELRSAYEDTVQGISRKYGEPRLAVDRCNVSSEVFCADENWMYALNEKKRDLKTYWIPVANAGHVSAIAVEAVPVNLSRGALQVTFEFTGWSERARAQREKEDQKY